MNRLPRFLLCSCLLVAAAAAQKQSSVGKATSVTAYKLIAVKVTGTARYTDKEVLAASGLQLGQNAADNDFKEAVQRLGDSGVFSNVVYSYSFSSAGTKLELQLADTGQSKLVPARFENFVWFTDDELRTAIENRVPLFKQLLPIGGNLPDRVSEALQAILSEKHFPGRVDYLRNAEASSGTLTAIAYRVEEVGIRIRAVEFRGASPEHVALLTAAARRLTGAVYDRSTLAETAKFDLLPVYLQRGYLKAAFGPSDARVLPQAAPSPSPSEDAQTITDVQVDAILPVMPGKVYSTSGVDWKGNAAIAASEIAPLLHLPSVQPADAVRLSHDLESVSKLYRSRGYMRVQIKPDAQFDEDNSTVRYDMNVVEGDLFKMGELDIAGLDTQTKAKMRAAWTLREGEPYNAEYPRQFLDDTRQFVPTGVQWAVTVHESVDAKAKTVDVEIRFKQR
jgi:outer membrane protein insertion porin family